MNYNKVQIAGNLCRDIEIKYTQSNKAVASFSIAVNNRYKAADGTQKEDTTFIDCEAWGVTAETMAKYLSKGRPVFLDGRLRQETWEDKTTRQKRSKLKVVVDTFHFVGPKPQQDGYANSPNIEPRTTAAPRQKPDAVSGEVYTPVDEDDIPFD